MNDNTKKIVLAELNERIRSREARLEELSEQIRLREAVEALVASESTIVAYRPDQSRDEGGRFEEEGKGNGTRGEKTRREPGEGKRPGKTINERLNSVETLAIYKWTESGYRDIRDAQKLGKDTPEVETFRAALDQADAYEGTAYRGGEISPAKAEEYIGPDRTIILRADSSASVSKDISLDFATDESPAGLAGRRPGTVPIVYELGVRSAADIRPVSTTTKFEQEVVLRQGTRYKIESWSFRREGKYGYYHVKGSEL